ncbi:SapC family protein [Sphingomonas bacterium]|uniref:SapC family protein n=1 Tax=Sphingomonas bacterium TaxID=1895847 RepID=UPI00262E860C|nr:SapC family protein [Sphingomonas bacterium]MDB5679318.1 multidrug transporter [Sphingomonas bacterium]
MPDHAVLTADDHRDLRVRTDRGAALGDAVMCCMAMPSEFREVQAHYPILFQRDIERDAFSALAMFGFENGENLFLEGACWDAGYVPLAIRTQPFLIGGKPGEPGNQVHVDMASARIATSDDGMRVFDEEGRPTPYLEAIVDQLGALDAGYAGSGDFFAALRRHDLLEPLSLEITLDDGSTNRLVGFHVIDEARLAGLDAEALGALSTDDHLMPIFMAVASIGRLRELIARKNAAVANG